MDAPFYNIEDSTPVHITTFTQIITNLIPRSISGEHTS